MNLWNQWYTCVRYFQPACSRNQTYIYLVLVLLGFTLRTDLAGVTSFIRALWLHPIIYERLLHFFCYSTALNLNFLLYLWIQLVQKLFTPVTWNGYVVYVADGIKIAKEGRKMPGVKKLHQSSENNSKSQYIMGHSLQAISQLAKSPTGHVAAVPLIARIHEGLKYNPESTRSLLDKLVEMFVEVVPDDHSAILVADAYYASWKVIFPLLEQDHHLLTRVRTNAVAYLAPEVVTKGKRGGTKIYGKKIQLNGNFKQKEKFTKISSPVYGEKNIEIQIFWMDLLWRPVGQFVRFVWVIHPTRGTIILMCTDTRLTAEQIVELYGYRFKIEVGFRQAIYQVGTYAYHFWLKNMKPIRRGSGDQNLQGKSKIYRKAIERKMEAYHRHIQLACIAQGLMIHFALNYGPVVWQEYRGWLRTMKKQNPPSELVVASTLRSTLGDFLLNLPDNHEFKRIISQNSTILKKPYFD